VPLGSTGNPSFLGKRQRDAQTVVETELRYIPETIGDHAGLAIFADERHFYFTGLWRTEKGVMLVVSRRGGPDDPEEGRIVATAPIKAGGPVRLRIGTFGPTLQFSYAFSDGDLQSLYGTEDGRMLASEASNQFTGTVIGVYASTRR
jgi:xylan 1,4-beta-xylosidase